MPEVVEFFPAGNGTRLAYRVIGDGPRLVTCLHWLALDGSWFAPLSRALGDEYSLLCPDFRGHGASDLGEDPISLDRLAADVVALWDHLHIQSSVVFGVSLGGMVAQALLAAAPSRVDALVVMASTHAYDEAARAGAAARAEAARTVGGMASLEGLTLQRWFGDAAAGNDPTVERARAQLLAADGGIHADYLEAMTAVGSCGRPAELPPTLVLGGDDDRSTPWPVIEALAASLPGSRLRFTPGGHLAAFSEPAAVATELTAFLLRTPQPGPNLSIEDIRTRVHAAETPALLMMVAHVTDDVTVLRGQWRPDPNQLPHGNLGSDTEAEIREFCLARLEPHLPAVASWPDRPSDGVLEAIGSWSLGDRAHEARQLLGAAFVPDRVDRWAPTWRADELAPGRRLRVAIVGAGISGLLAGLRMKQAGVEFTIFEKGSSVGGTWWENTYPDCRTDVHSHIYTYSFFPHEWPSYFSRQHVILDYLRRFAEDNDLLRHIAFNTEVTGAEWDDGAHSWAVTTLGANGAESAADVDILVSAVGQLNRPMIPDLPGLSTFAGPAFHSAQWDHGAELSGKRVAVIGTGASALQFAPALARTASQVTVFQRSAPWLQPTPELRQDIGADEAWLMANLPLYRAYYRFSIFLPRAVGQLAAATVDLGFPPSERAVSAENERLRVLLTDYLVAQVGDREDLRAQVVPDYPPGAKRIVRDDGTWISTLKRDNVRLVSDRVERVDEAGVWTQRGEHIPVDAIIFGTGFKASDFLTPMAVKGVGGKDLHETWGIDACAYMGLTVPGFPNLFCLYGPNTNLLLHGNLVFFLECQANYLASAVRVLLESGHSAMSLRPQVYEEYRDEVNAANAQRVWGWSKTHSWYQNEAGRSTIMWPLSAQRYLEGTQRVCPEHYEFS
jgi:4-hydroxyacetophenone monooxygenase